MGLGAEARLSPPAALLRSSAVRPRAPRRPVTRRHPSQLRPSLDFLRLVVSGCGERRLRRSSHRAFGVWLHQFAEGVGKTLANVDDAALDHGLALWPDGLPEGLVRLHTHLGLSVRASRPADGHLAGRTTFRDVPPPRSPLSMSMPHEWIQPGGCSARAKAPRGNRWSAANTIGRPSPLRFNIVARYCNVEMRYCLRRSVP